MRTSPASSLCDGEESKLNTCGFWCIIFSRSSTLFALESTLNSLPRSVTRNRESSAKSLICLRKESGFLLTTRHLAGELSGVSIWTPSILQHTMSQLTVKQLDYDLTPVAGLALVAHHLEPLAPVFNTLDGLRCAPITSMKKLGIPALSCHPSPKKIV